MQMVKKKTMTMTAEIFGISSSVLAGTDALKDASTFPPKNKLLCLHVAEKLAGRKRGEHCVAKIWRGPSRIADATPASAAVFSTPYMPFNLSGLHRSKYNTKYDDTYRPTMPITIIHCWSSPRSRSTALLYSFEARNDGQTIALDEPLYRRWLSGAGSYGISRPYATPFLEGLAPDGSDDSDAWRWEREKQCFNERIYHAVKSFVEKGHEDGCVFLKQMAKFSHLFDFETNWETDLDDNSRQWKDLCLQLVSDSNIDIKHRHLLLIRDPISVLSSWMGKSGDVHGNNPHPDEVGISQLFYVYSKVVGASMTRSSEEEDLIVLDSDDLTDNPRKILQELCASLRIEYTDSMLKWSAGPHKCDGPWGTFFTTARCLLLMSTFT